MPVVIADGCIANGSGDFRDGHFRGSQKITALQNPGLVHIIQRVCPDLCGKKPPEMRGRQEAQISQRLDFKLFIVMIVAAPMLGLGLIVGLMVSVFQATTSIQEQTLAFIPKIIAVFVAILIFGPWMLRIMTEYLTFTICVQDT